MIEIGLLIFGVTIMEQGQNGNKASKDNLAIIVGGLFIIAVVFAAYKYFNSGAISNTAVSKERKNESIEQLKGDLNGDGVKDKQTLAKSEKDETKWVATNYSKGDISGKSYTVKQGDTLWEIAEAVYGNGAEWTKILETNKGSIGYLPNGSQALIVVGQTLILP